METNAIISHWYERIYPKTTWQVVLVIGWTFCIAMGVKYFLQFGAPPILQIFDVATSADMYALRTEVTYHVAFNRHKVFFYSIPPVLTALAWTLYRSGLLGLTGAVVSIILGAVFGISFLHKTPVVFILLVIAGVDYSYGYVSFRRIWAYGGLGLGLILGGYAIYMKGYPIEWIMVSIVRRVTTPYVESTLFILEEIPRVFPFFWGRTLPNPRGIIPIESISLSAFVMEHQEGIVGAKPVPSIAEGYANFGWKGGMLFSGFVAAWLIFLRRAHDWAVRTPLGFGIWVVLSLSCYKLATQGLFTALDLRLLAAVSVLVGIAYLVEAGARDVWGARRPGGARASTT